MNDNNMNNGLNNMDPNVNNINSINQVQGVNPQMNNVNQVQEVNPQVNNVVQDMVMNQQVNNVVSNQDMNNNQNINVAENFLNVIKENTNDNVMISNSMDMNNNNLESAEAVSDTFNMNNIDVSQINNSIQNDVNNVNQVQEVNPRVNTVQDVGMGQQVNNIVDNQNIMTNTINVNDSFDNVNMVNKVNFVDNNVNQNLMVNNNNNNQVNNQSINNDINSNVDEELVRAYVGEKYDKIKNSSFSLPTFFLGSLYLFYRKMYLYGWLMMLLGPLSFIGFIIFAIKFKEIYLKDVSKKVNKIKLKNSNLSNEELKNICSKKGGTSIGGVLLNTFGIFVVLIVIVILLTFMLGASMFAMIFGTLGSGNVEIKPLNNNGQNVIVDNDISEDDFYEYVTLVNDDSINIKEIFTIDVPNEFKDFGMKHIYSYSYLTPDDSGCQIEFGAIKDFSSMLELVNVMKNKYDVFEEKDAVVINDITWYNLNYNSLFNYYNYITEKDGKVYLFEYEMIYDNQFCENNLNNVLNSIKFK